jgi:hypothetical protein
MKEYHIPQRTLGELLVHYLEHGGAEIPCPATIRCIAVCEEQGGGMTIQVEEGLRG